MECVRYCGPEDNPMKSDVTPTFFNRELSWLEFNQRVLDLACDNATPPLERLKFLAITGSNLDEFFMVRVGELHMLAEEGLGNKDPSGLTPRGQLDAIGRQAHSFALQQERCFAAIRELLAPEGIRRMQPADLSSEQLAYTEKMFINELFPVLSPIAIPSTLQFPPLSGGIIHIAVSRAAKRAGETPRFAVIALPKVLSRIVALPSAGRYEYMLMEDLVAMHVALFFPGETINDCVAFRITRNAALKAEDELAADLMVEMTDIISKRRKSDCLRMELHKKALTATVTFLQKGLRLGKDRIYVTSDVLDYSSFMRIAQLPGFSALKDEPWPPIPLLSLKPGGSMFELISRRDFVLNHPYDSFDPVVRFVEEAADDPDTIAIKQTLYRTGKKSRIAAALARAAENGKYVTAIVELKARFEEERNIGWARELEDAGVQVIYGIKGFKTHAKVCLVVRRERGGIKKYTHFGTGNYNELTAQLYTDVSLFTSQEDLAADASSFFNVITGHSQPMRFHKIAAAPIDLRESIVAHIEAETQAALQGRPAYIKAKINSLVDVKIIRTLYNASRAGVRISLNIRGICCLRPGVAGLSENISVVSVVDRFLEHSRIFWFHGGGAEKVFISSADWMPRNLDKRCELLVPVDDPQCAKRCMDIIETNLGDTTNCWELLDSGRYRRRAAANHKGVRSQEKLYRFSRKAAEELRHARRTEFETHHPKTPSAKKA